MALQMTPRQFNKDDYDVREFDLKQELIWFATENDRAIGVIFLDRVDKTFGWAVLTETSETPGYVTTDLEHSIEDEDEATRRLYIAMEKYGGQG